MPRFDHVNVTVVDGPRVVRFLEQVLEAHEGFRPPFDLSARCLGRVSGRG
jgi:hypothetical protein